MRVGEVRRLFELFMSPGSVTERVTFFAATYSHDQRVSAGGGLADEGEDIEVARARRSTTRWRWSSAARSTTARR